MARLRSLALCRWVLLLTASSAGADTYPARPVTIVTPFAAGSQTDAAARLMGQYLQDALGQSKEAGIEPE